MFRDNLDTGREKSAVADGFGKHALPSDLGANLLSRRQQEESGPYVQEARLRGNSRDDSSGGRHRHDHHTDSRTKPDKKKDVAQKDEPATEANFPRRMNNYWKRVDAIKKRSEYTNEFPPVYPGMDKPRPLYQSSELMPRAGKQPSINDILSASKDLNRIAFRDKKQPDFAVREVDENTFKLRYAQESVRVGQQFNLDKSNVQNMVQRIYAFEDGGWGTHQTLSNMPQFLADESKKEQRRNFHPTSSAIGYNQLLISTTANDILGSGHKIASRLEELAAEDPARAKELQSKANLMRSLQELPGTPSKKLTHAMHALNLDGDIGPVIQSQELANLLKFAKDRDFQTLLKERSNVTLANAGRYDALSPESKKAAVDELFSLLKPVTTDPPNTSVDAQKPWDAAKSTLKDKILSLPADQSDLLTRDKLTDDEATVMNTQVLQLRKYGGDRGAMSENTRNLVDKINLVYFGGMTADAMMPAAVELANLAGLNRGLAMLRTENTNLPTTNFFSRPGYDLNPVVARRSADELLVQINRVMYGPNSNPNKPGNAAFIDAFKRIP